MFVNLRRKFNYSVNSVFSIKVKGSTPLLHLSVFSATCMIFNNRRPVDHIPTFFSLDQFNEVIGKIFKPDTIATKKKFMCPKCDLVNSGKYGAIEKPYVRGLSRSKRVAEI